MMAVCPPLESPDEPWRSFLAELDGLLDQPADLHCIGGFAISQYYGFARETADLDVLSVTPQCVRGDLARVAGKGSVLERKHRVRIDQVGVASFPDSYESRLLRAWPVWEKLRIWIPEPHDLALTKLERSNERDIRDVMFLAAAGLIDHKTLIARFVAEMEPYLCGPTPTWHRTTLNMWIDSCWPEGTESPSRLAGC